MSKLFKSLLGEAEGRSEFIIVVVADIRGFSSFSKRHESPDIAMYIKRAYLEMINKYFSSANFYKPTGDGLLITFPYSEKNLNEVSKKVIDSCMQCLLGFPNLCAGDPMINFQVPQQIGFGIARGTACCLFSGKEILDYSGHLLNLATRLMDLARPSGIVIDGNFLQEVIPESYRNNFEEQKVYLRSIAEESPITVYCLKDYVEISEIALTPLKGDNWHTIQKDFTVRKMANFSVFRIPLPCEAKSSSKIRVTLISPSIKNGREIKGYAQFQPYNFTYVKEGEEAIVTLDFSKAKEFLLNNKVPQNRTITFKIQFVPVRLIKV